MNFTLRPYQQKFVDTVIKYMAQFKQIVACAATGSGKTKMFISITERAHSKGFTVLIITEASKIYNQLTDEVHAGNINADVKDGYIEPGRVYIGMAQTLSRRPKMVKQFQDIAATGKLLIINDEAHIGTATKLLKQFLPSTLLIGFTATPDFKFAKHLPVLYQAIAVGPQPDELVSDGYLCSYRHCARVLADLDDLKLKNGEFTEESQQFVFETKKVMDGLITDLRSEPYRKAIIFTSSIKHCEDTLQMLQNNGINCIQVHSKITAAKQSYDMALFTDADSGFNVCVSVGILTKGWDFPPIDLVILYRATTSLPLYLQMIGRGSRTHDGKQVFTVLDYGGNYTRHGFWDAYIDWNKKWNTPPKKKDAPGPVKTCPKCDSLLPASIMLCKYCGHIFEPVAAPGPTEEETKLIELTAHYRTLIGKRISELTPNELALYARLKNKKPYAARVAKAKEQQGYEGFLQSYANCMSYLPGWVYRNMPAGEKIEFYDTLIR